MTTPDGNPTRKANTIGTYCGATGQERFDYCIDIAVRNRWQGPGVHHLVRTKNLVGADHIWVRFLVGAATGEFVSACTHGKIGNRVRVNGEKGVYVFSSYRCAVEAAAIVNSATVVRAVAS